MAVYRNLQEQVYENAKDIEELSVGKTYRGPYNSLDDIDELLVGGIYLISDSNGSYNIYRCDDADRKTFTSLGKFGAKGDKGDIGPAGPKGEVGPKGEQGLKGDKGESGTSFKIVGQVDSITDLPVATTVGVGTAYFVGVSTPRDVYAVVNQNTEIKWVNQGALQGPKGEVGPQGPQGEVGPQGPQGEKGEKGDIGPAGKDGKLQHLYKIGVLIKEIGPTDGRALNVAFSTLLTDISFLDSYPHIQDKVLQIIKRMPIGSTITGQYENYGTILSLTSKNLNSNQFTCYCSGISADEGFYWVFDALVVDPNNINIDIIEL